MISWLTMQDLRVLCDVAKHHSFSRAAAEHGITQSAASQRVGLLEKRLGVTLIDRSVRPLELTEAGREFFEGCQDLLERFERLKQRVSRLGPAAEGTVRIDAIYSAGIDLLNHVKELFEPQHPGVRVMIEYKQPDEVYEAVLERRCDLGILSYPRRWRQVQVIPLWDEPMAVVCSPNHPLAGQRRLHASELAGWPMACFEPELPVGRRIKEYLRENGVVPTIASEFDNIDTIKEAVEVTDQVAILPKRTVQREVAAGTLSVVDLKPQLQRPMGIIYRRGNINGRGEEGVVASLGRPAQMFVDFLLRYARDHKELVEQSELRDESVARRGHRKPLTRVEPT